ncbi:hypothetical protein O6H91_06G053700 [Diphasiastrum complanatum]|uniref:Uncharacterized protein n=1 Tax=Diphasiastrum complanatum TaxID=34168 RepID=A0ACC2DDJ2_DIPCM|nr:hypothetical protein O6H91_06G053700 [Diphasiastrum complanatum]
MADAREARRQRILARGADRLAYITGERKSMDRVQPDVAARPVSAAPQESNVSTAYESHSLDASSKILAHVRSEIEAIEANSSQQSLQGGAIQSGKDHTLLPSIATVKEERSLDGDKADAIITSSSDGILRRTEITRKNLSSSTSVFTLKGLNASIDFSARLRATLASFIAVLAAIKASGLLCHFSYAHVVDRVVPSWPIYLVVITDPLLVLSVLLLGFVKSFPQDEKQSASGIHDTSADSLTKALDVASAVGQSLDVALLLAKALRALFLDCSIYIVVLISFLPFAQQWAARLCL